MNKGHSATSSAVPYYAPHILKSEREEEMILRSPQCQLGLGQVRPGHWAEGGTAEWTKAPALQALALHALYNTYPRRRRRHRPKE